MPGRYRTFQASSSPPAPEWERMTIIDPGQWTELHDLVWALGSQTDITNYVHPKADSGFNGLSWQATGGPTGGPCMAVHCVDYFTGTNATWVDNVISLDGSPDLRGVRDGGSAPDNLMIDESTSGWRAYDITAVDNTAKTVTLTNTPNGTSGRSWILGDGLFNFWVSRRDVNSQALHSGTNATWDDNVVALDGNPDMASTPTWLSIDSLVQGQNAGWRQYDVSSYDNVAKTVTVSRRPHGTSGRPWRLARGGGPQPNPGTHFAYQQGTGWNGFEMYLKFPPGHRHAAASVAPGTAPYQHVVVGTYQAWTEGTVEGADNSHYYLRPFLRFDEYDNGWMRIVIRDVPDTQRSKNQFYPPNVTIADGNFWDLLTRFYVDSQAYYDHPEIARPYKVLVGPISFVKIPPRYPQITMSWDSYSNGQSITTSASTTYQLNFTITNGGDAIEVHYHECGNFSHGPSMWIEGQEIVSNPHTLPSGNTQGYLQLALNATPQNYCWVGIQVIPTDELTTWDGSRKYPNFTGSYVESRAGRHGRCPLDAEMLGLVLKSDTR